MVDKWLGSSGIVHDFGGSAVASIFKAAAPISKNLFVKLAADGPPPLVRQATAVDYGVIGVALSDAEEGSMVPVAIAGIVKVEAGGTIVAGQAVCSDNNGKAVALGDQAVNEGGTATYTIYYAKRAGIALQSAEEGDKILILLR
ncbi:MAG: DUF2190 family protein [Nitrososphaerales archaeon]